MTRISSFSERPISDRPRRLSDWLNSTGERKVHSLVDKVYKRKNLELAWYRVKRNKGAGGVDGVTLGSRALITNRLGLYADGPFAQGLRFV